ncbi:hypothetical protein BKA61DRAFT_607673 [Leptodontidium sp. MPI-SDFR-AT-0119]|nr:hypothetical protein BKA61DRAFT_607673 [Leptodontidium sp. MPI-SDFR-AT-0119]
MSLECFQLNSNTVPMEVMCGIGCLLLGTFLLYFFFEALQRTGFFVYYFLFMLINVHDLHSFFSILVR